MATAQVKRSGASTEEDDEFEEFALDDWASSAEEGSNMQGESIFWDKAWDNDSVQDRVGQELRAHLLQLQQEQLQKQQPQQ
ncbi:hypothetical protein CEUSTIGMA_g9398.t1 [Chlamydomonas eustigma]|uniref:26S proteasome complex subunit SEM1 n=1 Tax=Chlamydomonas eustigma TaxID=1157962 RepID=A0A250XGQ2_9CHLO|nr:hypothetical protein CEUSTIGMA_g9398.t1 [Chlamydomonas eustigma]|eukprot:GAX81970.1 hypothetical protein CEUSTIGMA_g9398.t1 [Chlamydomonas eustigma]